MLIPIFEKYDIPIPKDHWISRLQASDTLMEARQAGVNAEIENISMHERLLAATEEPTRVLSNL